MPASAAESPGSMLMRNLLVLNFDGRRFGIWEDAVASLRPAAPVRRLPLSPPEIAGIAIVDGRSAAIADLAACLGLPAMTDSQRGTFLMIDPDDKLAGFGVESPIGRIACEPDRVLPLPAFAKTAVTDCCAFEDGSLIPLLNIRELHGLVRKGLPCGAAAVGSLLSGGAGSASPVSLRIVTIGEERFCLDAEGTDFVQADGIVIADLAHPSPRIAGVVPHEGRAVPVLRLGDLLGQNESTEPEGMLIVNRGGTHYAIPVDEDHGIIGDQDLALRELPLLARSPGLDRTAVLNGQVIPLVDAARLLDADEAGELPSLADRFAPASGFPGAFRQSDVDVVEFSLLGTRQAAPREEVREVYGFRPVRRLPRTREIVIGVAELGSELLPVLDLAAIFGRKSAAGPRWRMMRISNGDFDALAITDEVFGDRRLPRDSQRQVPIVLPHEVLYGCYLDGGLVRLVLNIEALTVHFEKTEIREMISSLAAPEPAPEIAPALRAEAAAAGRDVSGPEQLPSDAEMQLQAERERTEEQERLAEEKGKQEEYDREQAAEEARRRSEAEAREREREEQRMRAEEQRRQEELKRAEEAARQRAEAEARLRAEDAERERAKEEQRKREEEERLREAQRREEEAARKKAEAEAREREQEALRKKAAEEAGKRQEEEARLAEEARLREEERRRAAAAEEARREAEEAAERAGRETAAADAARPDRSAAAFKPSGPATPTLPAAAVGQNGPERRHSPSAEKKRGRYYGLATAAAIALVVALYLLSSSGKGPAPAPPVPVKREAPAPPAKSAETPAERPALYLNVPAEEAAAAPFVYTVVKGDNLWNISKRFTGNPFNYPRVAKDNRIATPDLIFPGQKIEIRNELAPRR